MARYNLQMLSNWYQTHHISSRILRTIGGSLGVMVGILSISRLVYEALFPVLDWVGRVEIVLPIALLCAILTGYFLPRTRLWWLPLPLLFNLIWLADPAVDETRSTIVFIATLLVATLLWLSSRMTSESTLQGRWLFPLTLIVTSAALYLTTMSHNVGMADTFEFQVTAPKLGIVHPTGYPLYLMLGKLWTLIPYDSIAWRLNFGTAVYGVFAFYFTYRLIVELSRQQDEIGSLRPWVEPSAFVATLALATLPIVWGQSIAAEVYSLHLLLVAVGLWLINLLLTKRTSWDTGAFWLALLLGLGMTNHVTTVFMLPAAALVMWLTWPKNTLLRPAETYLGRGTQLAFTFLVPLSLYAYLPIRWRAVNGEPMGFRRFIDWVVGGRFQGALQWRAPFTDPQRFEILLQLILDQWPLWMLALALVGLIALGVRRTTQAAALVITAIGYTYYTLSYYVPDLAVFMLPIHLIIAIFCGYGLVTIIDILNNVLNGDTLPAGSFRLSLVSRFPLLLLIPIAMLTAGRFTQIDQSPDDEREQWARAVLAQDLAPHSAILADSEKHPPLYYIQQTENARPDLDIMILPDEAAYRAELDQRIAAGQTVYLARFLPQLAGIYNLQAVGPLTAVSFAPSPASTNAATASFNNRQIDLITVDITKESRFDPNLVQVDLTWRVNETPAEELKVFLRWGGFDPIFPAGRLPANDFLPFNGVRPGEMIIDFYQLPLTAQNLAFDSATLEVALAPPFTPTAAMDWQEVGEINLSNGAPISSDFASTDVRILTTDRFNNNLKAHGQPLSTVRIPTQMRPGPLPTSLGAFYPLEIEPAVNGDLTAGSYDIFAGVNRSPLTKDGKLRCGWLRWPQDRCLVGNVTVSGVPLADGAINYGDQIALVDYATNSRVSPSGQIDLQTEWQGLTKIDEDYTIFIQVLNQNDAIVGQLDIKPAQGTRPTNLWDPGETLADNYLIPLSDSLSAEDTHRLIIGFYRLSDFQRITILDPAGAPIGDHFVIPLETTE